MQWMRSLLFQMYFVMLTTLITLTAAPLFLLPERVARIGARLWAKGTLLGLKYICNIDAKFEGLDLIPKNGGAIIASQHQSAWETIAFCGLFPKCCFVIKKELTYIPLLGFYFLKMGCIPVDRGNGATALKKMLRLAKKRLEQGYQVIIFPEGTRVPVGEKREWKPGFEALRRTAPAFPVFTITLNSGSHWPRKGFLKTPGVVRVKVIKGTNL